jgi:ABC-2 type transport system ATP-binding protein
MAPPLAVEARGLVKTFGATTAVDRLDLAVPSGTVFGLLGPDGAGKTTTLRILASLLRPDAGRARVFGHDTVAEAGTVRQRVSLTGQFASLDADLTGAENLTRLARQRGFRGPAAGGRAADLLDAFELAKAARRPVRSYPDGMRRRLDLGASIVTTPDILLLDEPTKGLAPVNRNRVWVLVRALADYGTTVLLATTSRDEAYRLAEQVTVLDRGRAQPLRPLAKPLMTYRWSNRNTTMMGMAASTRPANTSP